jgi:hypothetical protein
MLKNPPGHGKNPPPVYHQVSGNKDSKGNTGPVMYIAQPGERQYETGQAEHPHEEGELEKTGNKTDEEHNPHQNVNPIPDYLQIHLQSLPLLSFVLKVQDNGTCDRDISGQIAFHVF